jgi:hypothetical protein
MGFSSLNILYTFVSLTSDVHFKNFLELTYVKTRTASFCYAVSSISLLLLCLTNYALCHAYGGVVRFTPRPRYPRYPLDRRLSGPQNRSGGRGEDKNLGPTGAQTPTPRPSSRYTDCAIPAPPFRYYSIHIYELCFKFLQSFFPRNFFLSLGVG